MSHFTPQTRALSILTLITGLLLLGASCSNKRAIDTNTTNSKVTETNNAVLANINTTYSNQNTSVVVNNSVNPSSNSNQSITNGKVVVQPKNTNTEKKVLNTNTAPKVLSTNTNVDVPPATTPAPTARLTASTDCPVLQPAVLTWNTTGAQTVTLESSTGGDRQTIDIQNAATGNVTINSQKTTSYYLTATNQSGQKATAQVRLDRPNVDPNYPIITGYADTLGVVSHSSSYNGYGCGGKGQPIAHIGDTITLTVDAYDPNGDPLVYRFSSVFPSAMGVTSGWTSSSTYTWTFTSADVGSMRCVYISVKDNDGYDRIADYDDTSPACYDIAHP